MITQEIVKELFEYRDGELYWQVSAQGRQIKKPTGNIDSKGYKRIGINGKAYLNHRIIFLMFHGYLPEKVDHKDTNPLNNRIDNLREITPTQNGQNRKINKNNKSGVKGVVWHKQSKKWQAQLNINGIVKYFGLYKDIDYAKFIIEAMRYKYHGKFANHGGN